MRIETSISHQIEDLPRASSINIDGGIVDVAITRGGYTIAQVSELIVALTEAQFLASGGVREASPETAKRREGLVLPRVFKKGDPEPADVATVMDRDGSVWWKGTAGWGIERIDSDDSWEYVAGKYAPLTEVMES